MTARLPRNTPAQPFPTPDRLARLSPSVAVRARIRKVNSFGEMLGLLTKSGHMDHDEASEITRAMATGKPDDRMTIWGELVERFTIRMRDDADGFTLTLPEARTSQPPTP